MSKSSIPTVLRMSAKAVTLVAILLISAGCSTISKYNETSYQYATSLKPEALMLMDKATEEYSQHVSDAEALMLKMEQAYEYVSGIPKNQETSKQWEILKDPDGHLLGGFMQRWNDEGTLNATFIENAKDDLVGPAFDSIIALESLKIKD